MGRIAVLDPTAPPPEDALGPGPEVDTLAGKLVGIRYDHDHGDNLLLLQKMLVSG